jgi:hypothetical protein
MMSVRFQIVYLIELGCSTLRGENPWYIPGLEDTYLEYLAKFEKVVAEVKPVIENPKATPEELTAILARIITGS